MRITLTLLALLPLAASAADESADAAVETMDESGPQDIVVTATRDRRSASSTPASVTRIDDETIADLGCQTSGRRAQPHCRRLRPAWQRRREPDRHPLAGARRRRRLRRLPGRRRQPADPAGGLLQSQRDVRTQLRAGRADRSVARAGLGDVRRQRRARHGQSPHAQRALVTRLRPVGLEGGSDSFTRVRFTGRTCFPAKIPTRELASTASRRARRAGATTRASTKRSSICSRDLRCRDGGQLRLRAAGTVLNQETAGFIQGYNSYRDEDIAKTNPNPEAFATPRARACRRTTQRATSSATTAAERRRHLPPLAHGFPAALPHRQAVRAQRADQLHAERHRRRFPLGKLTTRVALDAETAHSELTEYQPGPGDRRHAARRTPSGPPACTTTTPWTPGRWAQRWRSSIACSTNLTADRGAARRPD